jgi:hypothetical protein
MKLNLKLSLGLAVLALALVPGMGVADGVDYHPQGPKYHPEHPTHPPTSGPSPKGHAYGFYCKGFSKKHVKGKKGTPFSQCVHAMKVADGKDHITAKKACKALSKKHVKGKKGTPFSRCVKGVAQMRKERAATVSVSARA